MTASVDLVIARPKSGSTFCYEPWWIMSEYMNTHGLKQRDGTLEVRGKGVILDAVCGDGPERYNLLPRPVLIAEYNYSARKPIIARGQEGSRYVIENTLVMRVLHQENEGSGRPLFALPLVTFVALLRSIPAKDLSEAGGMTVPMSAFLRELPGECIVVPHVGVNLFWEIPPLLNVCGLTSSIVSVSHLR